jgi:predicted nucleotidyltransferase
MENPLVVLSEVARVLERQGITYVLVGSLASSMHGMYRSTSDIDLLADIKPEQVRPLLDALEKTFYVDELTVRQAIAQRRSFNAIHFDSVFKVDIFIPKADDFARKQLDRRELRQISPEIDQFLYVATAEDTVLAKLRWYREGDEVSTTQWSDVLGVLGAKPDDLDVNYLREWAEKLGVTNLLERAFSSVKGKLFDSGNS